jgi:cyclohexanone monooxygenase
MTDTLDSVATDTAPVDDLDFDPEALHAKYREERDKRLRADANAQYREITGQFAHYLDDPYVEPGFSRAPLTDEVEVVVVGGGFGGQLAAARLRQAGLSDIRIIEKGGDFGGTWYWNRYPGAACDIESYVYLPLLEEIGYVPKEKYSRAPEILAHSRAIGEHFDLYKGALFQTEVTGMRWDDTSARWIVSTNRGDALQARFVVMANGPLHRPKLPGIPGIESFKGHSFHTSRWDYGYTGGTNEGGLSGLKGKRVGVIGTGATAVQCVPHLGEAAAELYVFQRTPSSIDVRNNRPTDPEWARSLEAGWQQRRMDNFNVLVSGGFQEEDLVNDGWTDIIGNILLLARKKMAAGEVVEDPAALMQLADFRKMEQVRARVDSVVADPATAEALKPYYNQFCKRPCFHDEYLATFNRPSVHLIDTQGKGVEAITEKGVVANGVEYELDCLIYATGFEAEMTPLSRRAGQDIIGRGGVRLADKWESDPGASSLFGMMTRGFPNMFIMPAPGQQAVVTVNHTLITVAGAEHIGATTKILEDRRIKVFEVSEQAEAEWCRQILAGYVDANDVMAACTPSRLNFEGNPAAMKPQNGSYGGGLGDFYGFYELIRDWRNLLAAGETAGLELTAR